MGEYKVKIYPAAQQDLNDIVAYLNTLSPDAAIKYYDRIVEKIGSLAEMPERRHLLKDPQLRLRGYRTLIVDNYMVFYVVKGDTVQIRRILFGRRQYEWML
ncbi:MAG: type II toxin-antitoxin system RelE/ParE family toxin [Peptococcaceae bacterium]|nr:type II toxin-antitoxin system RelE/ParE family toxin [Peptococcaceae bacterium]